MGNLRLAVLVVLATFGPYLAPGLRVEQLVIYPVTVAVALRHMFSARRVDPPLAALIFMWFALLMISLVSGLFPPAGASGSMLAGIEALALPMCVMVLVAIWTAETEPTELLLTVQKWTVALMSVNSVVALAMSWQPALWPILSRYWWLGDAGDATGVYAAQLGRYGGIFNTPLNSGTAYSVALCAALYLYHCRAWRSSITLCLTAFIVVGGLLSQSKVFILGGLPIALVTAVILFLRKRPGALLSGGLAALAALITMTQTQWWTQRGWPYMSALFESSENPLYVYTSGRYGGDTGLSRITDAVMENAPLAGYGTLGPTLGPLDTVWAEMLARGGIVGLSLFVLWILTLLTTWMTARSRQSSLELWWVGGAMLVVALAAAMGGPAFTQNRSGTLLLLNSLLVIATLRSSASLAAKPRSTEGLSVRGGAGA